MADAISVERKPFPHPRGGERQALDEDRFIGAGRRLQETVEGSTGVAGRQFSLPVIETR
ncbi:MAG: hypothetical protein ACOCX2_04470 [Armatimonadota bacterium]